MDPMHSEEMSYKACNTEVLPVILDLHEQIIHLTNDGHRQNRTVPDFLAQVAYSVAHFILNARNDCKSQMNILPQACKDCCSQVLQYLRRHKRDTLNTICKRATVFSLSFFSSIIF